MTVLQALAILEAAVLECKQRNVNTQEVKEALDFLAPHIRPTWLVPQYRHHIGGERENGYQREGQQQVLRPSFEGIRGFSPRCTGERLDKLRREFATTHDVKVKKEIARLTPEYKKLNEPWRFVSK